jgi:hypothetical protein
VDGLIHFASAYLAGVGGATQDHAAADRPQLVVHLDRELTSVEPKLRASLEDGTHVSAETLRRVACDSGLVAAALDEGTSVLDIGRRTRAIPTAIRRALSIRDRGCRFPGCGNTRFLHGHHVAHWLHGGRTALENLVLLCPFHHRMVHEGGFGIAVGDRGEVEVRTPAGKPLPSGAKSRSGRRRDRMANDRVATWRRLDDGASFLGRRTR